ncbi:Ubiquinone/menaquinone biosynthesis C-methyltransferase UbiE [Varanus komodoensis]|nr:Ubiquinone/menaquinone biosynthesis C-methyltransferase UbiE [Varanus komodoensis]
MLLLGESRPAGFGPALPCPALPVPCTLRALLDLIPAIQFTGPGRPRLSRKPTNLTPYPLSFSQVTPLSIAFHKQKLKWVGEGFQKSQIPDPSGHLREKQRLGGFRGAALEVAMAPRPFANPSPCTVSSQPFPSCGPGLGEGPVPVPMSRQVLCVPCAPAACAGGSLSSMHAQWSIKRIDAHCFWKGLPCLSLSPPRGIADRPFLGCCPVAGGTGFFSVQCRGLHPGGSMVEEPASLFIASSFFLMDSKWLASFSSSCSQSSPRSNNPVRKAGLRVWDWSKVTLLAPWLSGDSSPDLLSPSPTLITTQSINCQ